MQWHSWYNYIVYIVIFLALVFLIKRETGWATVVLLGFLLIIGLSNVAYLHYKTKELDDSVISNIKHQVKDYVDGLINKAKDKGINTLQDELEKKKSDSEE